MTFFLSEFLSTHRHEKKFSTHSRTNRSSITYAVIILSDYEQCHQTDNLHYLQCEQTNSAQEYSLMVLSPSYDGI